MQFNELISRGTLLTFYEEESFDKRYPTNTLKMKGGNVNSTLILGGCCISIGFPLQWASEHKSVGYEGIDHIYPFRLYSSLFTSYANVPITCHILPNQSRLPSYNSSARLAISHKASKVKVIHVLCEYFPFFKFGIISEVST